MGSWGAGLYSSDDAIDLRATIVALTRLPFEGDAILAELRKYDASADDPQDESHTVFWLVAADQFAKRGIVCREATTRALKIIDSGQDIARHAELGLSVSLQRSRQKKLAELARFLRSPRATIRRRTLAAPQPLLLPPNSVWRYPTKNRKPRNPYFASAESEGFVADGWGALLVLQAGRAFGWLSWYVVVPIHHQLKVKPELKHVPLARLFISRSYTYDEASGQYKQPVRIVGGPGTLTRGHVSRMGLELMGEVPIDPRRVPAELGESATRAATSDLSITNCLDVSQCEADGPNVGDWLVR